MKALPNYGKWAETVCAHESVTYVFDAEFVSNKILDRIQKLKAEGK